MKCDRCGTETNAHIMSFFNANEICMRCKRVEREHPDFDKAHKAEVEQIKQKNYNYKGVGVPADLVELSLKAKAEDDAKDQ